jgi:hypothetical protein
MFCLEKAKTLARQLTQARQAQTDALDEQSRRTEFASRQWGQIKAALRGDARSVNATAGEKVLIWESPDPDTFSLTRRGIPGRLTGTLRGGSGAIDFLVLERPVPLQVEFDYRHREYQLVDSGGHKWAAEELAETLIGELLTKD